MRQLPRTVSPAGWHLHFENTVWKQYRRVEGESNVRVDCTNYFMSCRSHDNNCKTKRSHAQQLKAAEVFGYYPETGPSEGIPFDEGGGRGASDRVVLHHDRRLRMKIVGSGQSSTSIHSTATQKRVVSHTLVKFRGDRIQTQYLRILERV